MSDFRFNVVATDKYGPVCSGCGLARKHMVKCPSVVCTEDPCLEVTPVYCVECSQKIAQAGSLIRLA